MKTEGAWTSMLAIAGWIALVGCTDTTAPVVATELAAVVPAGGAVAVDAGTTVTVTFTHPMMEGMEEYMVLHLGDVTGPLVPGTWSWSADGCQATFQPLNPLEPKTLYTIHLGGGMMDWEGHAVGFAEHGVHMGGVWATGAMMGGGGMMGGGMMGQGWMGPNGTYGMVFSFTTA